ncbi:MAG: hypothetical protein E7358_06590 [Clostridiales bacterium]|nr:hypothetical protein [Clostridiales bacterium]
MKKIILSLALTFCFSLGLFCPIYNVSAKTYSSGEDIEVELKNVDLTPYVEANKTDIITLSEVGFGTDDYKLIVYVFNHDKKKLSKNSVSNKINVAIKYDANQQATEYDNFCLKYISSTKDEQIYKFSIVDKNDVLKNLATEMESKHKERRYNVAGVQLFEVGKQNAHDNKVAKGYIYSGDKNELKVKGIETIQLEVHPVYYRTQTSDIAGAQNQLNSVYFSIPNKYLEDNFNLVSVKCEWYEYELDSAIVVDGEELFNRLNEVKGEIAIRGDSRYPVLTSEIKTTDTLVPSSSCYWSYNWTGPFQTSNTTTERITLLFNKDKGEAVTSEEVKDAIYDYSSSYVKGVIQGKNGQVSADLFKGSIEELNNSHKTKEIFITDEYNLLSYSDTHNWWQSFWQYGFNAPDDEESKKDIQAIYKVEDKDVLTNVSENLLIEPVYVEDFAKYYSKEKLEGKSTHILRFANSYYKAVDFTYGDDRLGPVTSGFVAWETVYFDFDVIHLGFSNGEETLIVPVVADPVDLVGGLNWPTSPDNNWIWWLIGAIAVCAVIGLVAFSREGK